MASKPIQIDDYRPQDAVSRRERLKTDGGDGTYDDMSTLNFHGRLSAIEGGVSTFRWAVGIVSAVMIGAMAVLVAIAINTRSELTDLTTSVNSLPDRINQNLMEMNRMMLEAIRAGRDAPTIIVVPQQEQTPSPEPQ